MEQGGPVELEQLARLRHPLHLRDGHTLIVWGAWTGGRIVSWAGPVRSNRVVPVPNNSTVHADGTVGFHG